MAMESLPLRRPGPGEPTKGGPPAQSWSGPTHSDADSGVQPDKQEGVTHKKLINFYPADVKLGNIGRLVSLVSTQAQNFLEGY